MKKQLRSLGNSLVGTLPTSLLRMFFKAFETRQELAEAAGFHVLPRRSDSAVMRIEEIDFAALARPRALPGIDLRVNAALELLTRLKPFAAELDVIPYEPSTSAPFWFTPEFLTSFPDYDTAVLYSLLRYLKPKRYVEVGCGYSSIVSNFALQRNQHDGASCDAVYADPEPRLPMDKVLNGARLILKRVQDVPLDTFKALQSGMFSSSTQVTCSKSRAMSNRKLFAFCPLSRRACGSIFTMCSRPTIIRRNGFANPCGSGRMSNTHWNVC